ncbi:hypothetical protein GCM10017559_76610 [Streptosporangium longisporum]|uniref:Uncharacterized protein n=1 Tax=Streptosporangium longisporum TaxID=46187 RepID=A0ABP6LAC6_9ACTN
MLAGLAEASHLSALEQLPALIAEHAAYAGLRDVLIYLADLQQEVLRLVTGKGLAAGADAEPGRPSCGSTGRWPGAPSRRCACWPGGLGERGAPVVGAAAGRHRTPRRAADQRPSG